MENNKTFGVIYQHLIIPIFLCTCCPLFCPTMRKYFIYNNVIRICTLESLHKTFSYISTQNANCF